MNRSNNSVEMIITQIQDMQSSLKLSFTTDFDAWNEQCVDE